MIELVTPGRAVRASVDFKGDGSEVLALRLPDLFMPIVVPAG
jgi:hypothetical protein